MPHPLGLITLLTDFGDRDYFVASMKGVILSIHPETRIVDLSHHIAPHQIDEAGYVLKSCYRSFPDGTIHVAVVDPGVGSNRRPLLVSSSRYYFLAPDNGLLTYVMKEEDGVEVRHIENKQYRLEAQGVTFDGRDLFAPAAAWLAKGQPLASFGRLVNDPVRLPLEEPVWRDQQLVGHIVYVDRFGNLISNIMRKHLEEVGVSTKHSTPEIHIAQQTITGLVVSYSEGERSRAAALLNSSGFLEIFVKEGSAAEELGLKSGALITVS